MFEWGVESLTFSGGETVDVEKASMLIIVGPNNSGKSRALAEINSTLAQEQLTGFDTQANTHVVETLKTFVKGDKDNFLSWLEERFISRGRQNDKSFTTKRASVDAKFLLANFEHLKYANAALGPLSSFFVERLDTQSRLTLVNPAPLINPYTGIASEYIHLLQANESLLRKISDEFYKAFGKNLVINWYGHNNVYFHIGSEPERTVERDRVSAAYQGELLKLPVLQNEGDGVRSFVAILLATMAGSHLVLIIDEPEAFLHPKQAERLGSLLARSAETLNRQVIVSSHSSSVIRGAINASERVAVCRLTRSADGTTNHAFMLPSTNLKQLWSSPLLRSVGAIEGIFSNGVVVCEADTDTRFYEAALRQLEVMGRIPNAVETHFVHGNGKGKLAVLTTAYRRLRVPVAVVADLDLLRNVNEFKAVVEALGGRFESILRLYNLVLNDLNGVAPLRSTESFVAEARAIIDEIEGTPAIDREHRRKLGMLLEETARWSDAKRHGINKLRGGARQQARALLDELQTIGLFLVPTGELESWWLDGPADKKDWLLPAVQEIEVSNPDLEIVLQFMDSVQRYLSSQS